ncbi:MAG: hypothetical protein GJ676_01310 [Rhodobacteraceae bacterium]|nr:hypothetical protein [Paracoccaceae bacterium]
MKSFKAHWSKQTGNLQRLGKTRRPGFAPGVACLGKRSQGSTKITWSARFELLIDPTDYFPERPFDHAKKRVDRLHKAPSYN